MKLQYLSDLSMLLPDMYSSSNRRLAEDEQTTLAGRGWKERQMCLFGIVCYCPAAP